MATDPGTVPAVRDLAAEIQRAWDKEFSRPFSDGVDYRQARVAAATVMEAVEPFLAKPAELSDSERFRVKEAREALAAVWDDRLGEHIYGIERTLHDHAKNLLDLVDKIAPKGEADE